MSGIERQQGMELVIPPHLWCPRICEGLTPHTPMAVSDMVLLYQLPLYSHYEQVIK